MRLWSFRTRQELQSAPERPRPRPYSRSDLESSKNRKILAARRSKGAHGLVHSFLLPNLIFKNQPQGVLRVCFNSFLLSFRPGNPLWFIGLPVFFGPMYGVDGLMYGVDGTKYGKRGSDVRRPCQNRRVIHRPLLHSFWSGPRDDFVRLARTEVRWS